LAVGQNKGSFFGVALTRGGAADGLSTFVLAGLFVVCSVALISYNKYLMDYARFPHPTHLVWAQSLFISCFTALLLVVRPSLFPALNHIRQGHRMPLNKELMLGAVLPVAMLLTVSLVLSNAAFLHSSLVFLQMMRGGGVAFSYMLALHMMIERVNGLKMGILLVVLGATSLTIFGENSLNLVGFGMQGVALMSEGLRGSLQAFLLTRAGWKLDALTYVLLVMPVCMILLTFACAAKDVLGLSEAWAGPKQLDVVNWAPHLLANSCLAFLVNMLSTALVEHASSAGFSLAALARDVVVVGVGVGLIQETVSPLQGFGFCLQVCAVFVYALVRTVPLKMPHKLPFSRESQKLESSCNAPAGVARASPPPQRRPAPQGPQMSERTAQSSAPHAWQMPAQEGTLPHDQHQPRPWQPPARD